jgi:uncharacterized protein
MRPAHLTFENDRFFGWKLWRYPYYPLIFQKSRKYYFIDLGVRNAIIANFNPLQLRNDKGQLWENFLVIERLKRNSYKRLFLNAYFWRNYDKKEVDLVEEYGGKLHAYEFKWKKTSVKNHSFVKHYPDAEFSLIHSENYLDFIT